MQIPKLSLIVRLSCRPQTSVLQLCYAFFRPKNISCIVEAGELMKAVSHHQLNAVFEISSIAGREDKRKFKPKAIPSDSGVQSIAEQEN